jgi:hypothetical protein
MLPLVNAGSIGIASIACVLEAEHRHLNQEPALKRKLRERLNNYLLETYYTTNIVGRVTLSDADLAAAYTAASPGLVRLESAKLLTATLRDSAVAIQLAQHGGDAASRRVAVVATGGQVRVT